MEFEFLEDVFNIGVATVVFLELGMLLCCFKHTNSLL